MGHHVTQGKQSAFSLTAIQVTGATSLPVLNSSIELYHEYGFSHALWVLLLGNFFIWLIALAIIRMTAGTTKNTLDNTRDYFGIFGTYAVALVLITSTIAWFVIQTNFATRIIVHLLPEEGGYHINTFLQVGVALGVLSTVCSMEGIKGLRWVALISFPILIIAFMGVMGLIPHQEAATSSIQASIGSLAVALGTSLSVAVDYPTFFQHSKSKRDSLFAVTLIQGITFLIGMGGLFLGKYIGITTNITEWNVIFSGVVLVQILFFIMVVLSCFCVNTVNVYSASIAWEVVVPILAGRKEYTILGLGLTSIFILTTNYVPMLSLLTISDLALSNLCLVLVVGYFGKLWLKYSPPLFDKWVYFIGWMVGTIVALIGGLQSKPSVNLILLGFFLSIAVVICTTAFRKFFLGNKRRTSSK